MNKTKKNLIQHYPVIDCKKYCLVYNFHIDANVLDANASE